MRIITGTARGRKLKAPPGEDTRPTSDRIKETMFNILQFSLEGRDVLDLFAGSGQLGLEALSRGAKSCVFVETATAAADIIRENMKHTGLDDRGRLIKAEALSYLAAQTGQFDVILLDPPYRSPLLEKSLLSIVSRDLLRPGGFIMAEVSSDKETPEVPFPYCLQKRYECGSRSLLLYTRQRKPDNLDE